MTHTVTAQSSPDQVLVYHPLRDHYDDLILNPHKTWFGAAGPMNDSAQDRVILRRHIRQYWPNVAKSVDLKSMALGQLAVLINELRGETT